MTSEREQRLDEQIRKIYGSINITEEVRNQFIKGFNKHLSIIGIGKNVKLDHKFNKSIKLK